MSLEVEFKLDFEPDPEQDLTGSKIPAEIQQKLQLAYPPIQPEPTEHFLVFEQYENFPPYQPEIKGYHPPSANQRLRIAYQALAEHGLDPLSSKIPFETKCALEVDYYPLQFELPDARNEDEDSPQPTTPAITLEPETRETPFQPTPTAPFPRHPDLSLPTPAEHKFLEIVRRGFIAHNPRPHFKDEAIVNKLVELQIFELFKGVLQISRRLYRLLLFEFLAGADTATKLRILRIAAQGADAWHKRLLRRQHVEALRRRAEMARREMAAAAERERELDWALWQAWLGWYGETELEEFLCWVSADRLGDELRGNVKRYLRRCFWILLLYH